jgi:hypothetical protein
MPKFYLCGLAACWTMSVVGIRQHDVDVSLCAVFFVICYSLVRVEFFLVALKIDGHGHIVDLPPLCILEIDDGINKSIAS